MTTLSYPFTDRVTSLGELRDLIGTPWEVNLCKQLDSLDAHCRAFIARAPFMVVATSDGAGRCDVSPRGDAPGFVQVLDEKTLLVPERPGNRRADTLRNVLENPRAGLLFLIPGADETLRVNGRAAIVRDRSLLARCAVRGKEPLLAIALEVEECFIHCGRSFKRARLWDTETWPEGGSLPSLAHILMDHAHPANCTLQELEQDVAEAYARLY